ncbi:hypothetical protein ACEPAI_1931 [Sanghuangporus weigelae]
MATDSIAIPTGNFINIDDTAYDFQVAREIGASWNETDEYCGCQGYDNCWIYNEVRVDRLDSQYGANFLEFGTITTVSYKIDSSWRCQGGHRDKPDSGADENCTLQLQLKRQPLVSLHEQVYPLYWLNTPRKVIHSDPVLNRTKYSAVAIEQKGYIYAINTPEGHKSNGPGKDFSWSTTYRFSTVHYTPMHMRPGPSFWQVSGPFVFLEM